MCLLNIKTKKRLIKTKSRKIHKTQMVLKLYIEAKKSNRAVAQTLQTTLSWGHDEELNKNSQTEIVCGWRGS